MTTELPSLSMADQLAGAAEALRRAEAVPAELAKHERRVAALEAREAELQSQVHELQRQRDDHAKAIAETGDIAVMHLAVDAAVAAANRGNDDCIKQYLRSRGWKLVSGGWQAPEGGVREFRQALDLQVRHDAKPFFGWTARRIAEGATAATKIKQLVLSLG